MHGKLEQMARDECGLEKEDIIYTDHQAIVLKDWALIQDQGRRKQVMSKLNTNNENSFGQPLVRCCSLCSLFNTSF
ncbi:hypothetical protein N779_14575 [Vibrio coralliilyticus OCN008]|nr:hypothetical protein N779_14575 [Vibrio coralliilyticus OCN008]